MPRTTTISADKLATSETRTSTDMCLRANSFAQTVTCVENSPSRPWRQCRVIRVGRLKFDFLTVRNRGIRASTVHMRGIAPGHTGSLNRGTKGGGSIFVQAEHFPQITRRLTILESCGDRRRGARRGRPRCRSPARVGLLRGLRSGWLWVIRELGSVFRKRLPFP